MYNPNIKDFPIVPNLLTFEAGPSISAAAGGITINGTQTIIASIVRFGSGSGPQWSSSGSALSLAATSLTMGTGGGPVPLYFRNGSGGTIGNGIGSLSPDYIYATFSISAPTFIGTSITTQPNNGTITANGGIVMGQNSGSLENVTYIQTASASPAASGFVRMATGDRFVWRNNANTTDVILSKDTNDNINFPNNIIASAFVSIAANPASAGVLRLATADRIVWRNNSNTTDVILSKDSSDNLNFPNTIIGGTFRVGATGPILSNSSGNLVVTEAGDTVIKLVDSISTHNSRLYILESSGTPGTLLLENDVLGKDIWLSTSGVVPGDQPNLKLLGNGNSSFIGTINVHTSSGFGGVLLSVDSNGLVINDDATISNTLFIGGGAGPQLSNSAGSLSITTTTIVGGSLFIGGGAGPQLSNSSGTLMVSANTQFPAGTAGAPSIRVDSNAGLYRPNANSLGIVANGVNKIYLTADGPITIGATNEYSNSILTIDGSLTTGTSELNGIQVRPTVQAAATVGASSGVYSYLSTAVAAFTLPTAAAFRASYGTVGAGSAITRYINYYGDQPAIGTNRAFMSDNTTFSGSFFIHQTGAAASVLGGNLRLSGYGAGVLKTDASGNITANSQITRGNLPTVGEQLSLAINFTTNSGVFTDVTNAAVTITTTGRPVVVALVGDGNNLGYIDVFGTTSTTGHVAGVLIHIRRDGATVVWGAALAVQYIFGNGSNQSHQSWPASSVHHVETSLPAGTYTYRLRMAREFGTETSVGVFGCRLIAYEL